MEDKILEFRYFERLFWRQFGGLGKKCDSPGSREIWFMGRITESAVLSSIKKLAVSVGLLRAVEFSVYGFSLDEMAAPQGFEP